MRALGVRDDRHRRIGLARDALIRALAAVVDFPKTEDLATAVFFSALALMHLAAADVTEEARDLLVRVFRNEKERREAEAGEQL